MDDALSCQELHARQEEVLREHIHDLTRGMVA
jgi:hypothetical protein